VRGAPGTRTDASHGIVMTDLAIRVAVAATLVWLGMVLAISFLEAPLKFRAEGLELRVGPAIGRIVCSGPSTSPRSSGRWSSRCA
jgi:hypothetical protein